MPKPDLYVYLHADANQLLKNIKNRGRDYEQNISADYLEKIKEGYFNFLKGIITFPVLVIDINNVDFVGNQNVFKDLKQAIFQTGYKLGINRLILG
jgi:deoxyadenosine/deoxycytidine kinase